ncbi:hypothetical protein [Pelagicoccus sp. SDUM812003]|uniref:hypothetical protein n=1 Tax=Pelagicoccus sp. SDUM812003 TaxID=3041267 RepID=UPI00280E963B|nr:hypothetical protein [Pelagicoccus sp. SDUM812003]MDQ8202266.1 hypothetical protein [Pelagicoccus sp. SDUM812003]
MKDDGEKLDELLAAWDDASIEHPRLGQRVWSRIANEDQDSTALPGFFQLVSSILSRPIYAAAFVVGCVLLGLLLAEVRVSQRQVERGEQLAESYKQVIDPLLRDTYQFE